MVPKHCSVRTKSHKIIHYYQFDEWELFDLETDPQETTNVHDDPRFATVRKHMHLALERMRSEVGAPGMPGPKKR